MATEDLKSAAITNMVATPPALTNAAIHGGHLRAASGSFTPLAAADVASTYRAFRIPSNARVHSITVSCAAFAAGAVDIGLYAKDGGAVVDADFFASAVSLASKREKLEVMFESAVYTAANQEKRLWEALGLSSDPKTEYDVAATVTTQFGTGVPFNISGEWAV